MDITALFKLSYGMYVLTTESDGTPFGCIINTAFQITSKPPRIAVSVNRDNYTHSKIMKSKRFGVSVIAEDSKPDLIATFGYQSGKDTDKFTGFNHTLSENLSVPLFPEDAMATIECRLENSLDIGTHTLFIGEVVDCNITNPAADEMTYKYFHEVRKGMAPKNAPTYVEAANEAESYQCSVCKYIYDGETPFMDLPDDWVCPICGMPHNVFEKV